MSARSGRLGKLLEIEESRVTSAEQAVGEARARLAAAEALEAHAIAELHASMSRDDGEELTSTTALEDAAHRRSWLRAVMMRARSSVANARAYVGEREGELVARRIAARKVELLIESIARGEVARAGVAERRRDDEQAARWRAAR